MLGKCKILLLVQPLIKMIKNYVILCTHLMQTVFSPYSNVGILWTQLKELLLDVSSFMLCLGQNIASHAAGNSQLIHSTIAYTHARTHIRAHTHTQTILFRIKADICR